jgi:hypothetical protein
VPAPPWYPGIQTVMFDAIRRLGALDEPAAVARGHLMSALEGIMGVEALVTKRPASPSLSDWQHSIRDRVSAMTGWAAVMSVKPDAGTIKRGTAAIESSATALAGLLASPPE